MFAHADVEGRVVHYASRLWRAGEWSLVRTKHQHTVRLLVFKKRGWRQHTTSSAPVDRAVHVPGTSSVSLSLSIPRAHFRGLTLWASRSEEDVCALISERFGAPKRFLILDMASLWVVARRSLRAITI